VTCVATFHVSRKANRHSVRIWCCEMFHDVLSRPETVSWSTLAVCMKFVCHMVVSFGILLWNYFAFEGLTWSQRRTFPWAVYIVSFSVINVCFWRHSPQWARASSFTRFLDYTRRRTTVCRTPLDEWSARRRDLYLTTHTTLTTENVHSHGGIRTHNLSRRATTGTGCL
jgi:hypothetical protein